ncbi:MAG TPA: NUDIX domain-containing protein [Pseudonocardiaceae bacterium]|nr:NUDIX domain-containing protein [Pseudonocardiaceae bacterium]
MAETVVRCVGALVHAADGRLLLIRRANPPGRWRWSLPGGRVEPGETDAQAVIREVAEETGLRVAAGRLVGSVRRPGPGRRPASGVSTGPGVMFDIYDYECAVLGGAPAAGSDASGLRWVDAAAFAALDGCGALVDLLADTLRGWQALPAAR